MDCFVVNTKDERSPYHQLLRIVEGTRGHVKFRLRVVPRFDYGEVDSWLRYHGRRVYSATGGDDALVVSVIPSSPPQATSTSRRCSRCRWSRYSLHMTASFHC